MWIPARRGKEGKDVLADIYTVQNMGIAYLVEHDNCHCQKYKAHPKKRKKLIKINNLLIPKKGTLKI